ncbi:MAG: hypothetical protein KY395_00750 [Actinobacteria bacterium]|nr:hypothetical protein [Actinomycetota bacterium]
MTEKVARLVVVALITVVMGGCTGGAVDELPAPPTTGPTTSTTERPDLSGVVLAEVPGTTTTTVALTPGEARLQGVVTAREGLVAGATVLIERLVGDGVASATVTTGPDGVWSAVGILGGRYRVRAWRAPDLALTTPLSFFLENRESRDTDLRLESYTGVVVTSAVAPSPPIVDEPVRLVVRAYTRSVDEQGIVRNQAVPGVQMELTGSSQWKVETANPTFADDTGRAEWILRCGNLGTHALAVRVGGGADAQALRVPACATSDEEVPGSPSEGGATTSTTRRTTTST